MLKCAHCDKIFKYESERKRHQESHFPQFGCTVCEKKFSFLSALRRHQKQHERKGSVRCYECGGNFRDETLLKRHMQYAHTGSYSCSECSATFSSEQALRTHTKIHKPESEREFRCTFMGCKKSFNFPHHLKHHEMTHTNVKQHFCNVCQKGFIQSHHLKSHLKTHHPENCKQVHCTVSGCKKKFTTKHAWKKHITTHNKCTDTNHTAETKIDSGISSDSNPSNDIQEKDDSGDDLSIAVHFLYTVFGDCIDQCGNGTIFHSYCSKENGAYQAASGTCAVDATVESKNKCKTCCTYHCDSFEHTATTRVNGNSSAKYKEQDAAGTPCSAYPCADGQCSPRSSGLDNTPLKSKKLCTCINNNMPELEYRKDGIIKIRETFDVDILIVKEVPDCKEKKAVSKNKDKIELNDSKYIEFNSCKAVLGNCIVSEDGSVGEGCLCAKMIVDEQQMSAQEIEELTPNPIAAW